MKRSGSMVTGFFLAILVSAAGTETAGGLKVTSATHTSETGIAAPVSVPDVVENAARVFTPDTVRTEAGPGFHQIRITDPELPLHVVALEMDLRVRGNGLRASLAHDALDNGFEYVEEMARRHRCGNERVIGALNADYFGINEPENPYTFLSNGMIRAGEIVMSGSRNRSSFGMTTDGQPFIDRIGFDLFLELSGDRRLQVDGINRERGSTSLVLYNHYIGSGTQTSSSGTEWLLRPLGEMELNRPVLFEVVMMEERKGNMRMPKGGFYILSAGDERLASRDGESLHRLREGDRLYIFAGVKSLSGGTEFRGKISLLTGGGPRLLNEGEPAAEEFVGFEGFGENHSGRRHNRSAVGFNKEGNRLWLVAVDGRQPEFSRGATMAEMADIMKGLGAWNAINLDGGGSTTLVVRNRMVNRHDTLGTRRAVGNALLAIASKERRPDCEDPARPRK